MPSRVWRCLASGIVAGLSYWYLAIVLAFFIGRPRRLDNLELAVSIVIGVAVAIRYAVRAHRTRFYGFLADESGLEFYRPGHIETIDYSQIRAAVGIGLPDFSGGDMVLWKALIINTNQGIVRVRFNPEECIAIFERIRMCCPHCACLPHPRSSTQISNTSSANWEHVHVALVESARKRLVMWLLVMGVATIIFSVCLYFQQFMLLAQGLVYGIVLLVVLSIYALDGLRDLRFARSQLGQFG